MPRNLRVLFLLTDIGFLLYWGLSGAMALGLLRVPADWLFRDYTDPNIVAWNWSFLPLDLLASVTGLGAVWLARGAAARRNWQPLALISMTLTFCAGFLALLFWSFQCSFDLGWWASNLFLVAWPLAALVAARKQVLAPASA